jgi:hypothetical protein
VPLPIGKPPSYLAVFSAVFSQAYAHKAFTDRVAFWCVDDAALLSGLRDYCTTNHLTLTAERFASQPGNVYIKVQ